MQFSRELHQRIMLGEITLSVRIWKQPRVKVGGRYRMADGAVVVDAIDEIDAASITAEMARASGFDSVPALLKVARHGSGERVFVVHFHYEMTGWELSAGG